MSNCLVQQNHTAISRSVAKKKRGCVCRTWVSGSAVSQKDRVFRGFVAANRVVAPTHRLVGMCFCVFATAHNVLPGRLSDDLSGRLWKPAQFQTSHPRAWPLEEICRRKSHFEKVLRRFSQGPNASSAFGPWEKGLWERTSPFWRHIVLRRKRKAPSIHEDRRG